MCDSLHEVAGVVTFTETGSRLQVTSSWGSRSRELLLDGYGVSVWSDGKVLDISSGEGRVTW